MRLPSSLREIHPIVCLLESEGKETRDQKVSRKLLDKSRKKFMLKNKALRRLPT